MIIPLLFSFFSLIKSECPGLVSFRQGESAENFHLTSSFELYHEDELIEIIGECVDAIEIIPPSDFYLLINGTLSHKVIRGEDRIVATGVTSFAYDRHLRQLYYMKDHYIFCDAPSKFITQIDSSTHVNVYALIGISALVLALVGTRPLADLISRYFANKRTFNV